MAATAPERMRRWPAPTLMLVTERARLRGRAIEDVVAQAVDGGVNVVQLREKDLADAELREMAQTLRRVLRGRALLVVNGRIDVALDAGADGVHLPEDGIGVSDARVPAGDAAIIGCSVHSVGAARRAIDAGADYLVAGTIFATPSKPDAPAVGVALLRNIAAVSSVPLLAIGGVTAERLPEVIAAGAGGIAVIGAVWDAEDACTAAAGLRRALDEAYRP